MHVVEGGAAISCRRTIGRWVALVGLVGTLSFMLAGEAMEGCWGTSRRKVMP